MFFYVEECYFKVAEPPQYGKRCLELCGQIIKLNQTSFNTTEVDGIKEIIQQCKDKENCIEVHSNSTANCQLNELLFQKWTQFTFSILFTVGYGYDVPKSELGKVLTIVYAIVGIPIATGSVVFCGRFITAIIKYLIIFFESKVLKRDEIVKFKPKVIIIQVVLAIKFILLLALFYKKTGLKHLSFFNSFYFTFISISTIGFGDIKYNFREYLDYTPLERTISDLVLYMLFYISFSLLASIISSCVTLGTDSSYKKFKIVKLVDSRGKTMKVFCENMVQMKPEDFIKVLKNHGRSEDFLRTTTTEADYSLNNIGMDQE
ncbi:potassium channel subfamily K member 9-like [Clytia hemisphaerica]|uniref:potassium channel subfamily K member 9-like n=1 Tax=Clytia hemisphaerica TaxID=252671 RepID=UPI0034D4D2ED